MGSMCIALSIWINSYSSSSFLVFPYFITHPCKTLVIIWENKYIALVCSRLQKHRLLKKIKLQSSFLLTGSCKFSDDIDFQMHPDCWNIKVAEFNKDKGCTLKSESSAYIVLTIWTLQSQELYNSQLGIMHSQYRMQAIKICFVIFKTWNYLEEY